MKRVAERELAMVDEWMKQFSSQTCYLCGKTINEGYREELIEADAKRQVKIVSYICCACAAIT
jgi:hypothetical protein